MVAELQPSPFDVWDALNERSARRTAALSRADERIKLKFVGPRADAVPADRLMTIVYGSENEPTSCTGCGGRLLDRQPPLGPDVRGMVTCTTCSQQVCWLAAPLPSSVRPVPGPGLSPVQPEPIRPAERISGRFNRQPGCGPACSIAYGHNADVHEAYGRHVMLAELKAKRTGVVRTGPMTVDFDTLVVTLGAEKIDLTPTETSIVVTLAQSLGAVKRSLEIVEAVWGGHAAMQAGSGPHDPRHALRVNMGRLRAKLGTASSLIKTRINVGYMLVAEPPTQP